VDERLDFLEKLRDDLLEQFRGLPRTEVFMSAVARQLEELYEAFFMLKTMRSLQTAIGRQLDGIGDIAVMSRTEALVISKLADQDVPMDDDTYRIYLAWKIALNTTNCTHKDVRNALKMFWDKPLYYSEDPAHPATAIYTTSILAPEDNAWILMLAPKVKAAGVALQIIARTETPQDIEYQLRVGAIAPRGIMVTTLPQYIPEDAHDTTLHIVTFKASVMTDTTLPESN
jgi:hypothetical protein